MYINIYIYLPIVRHLKESSFVKHLPLELHVAKRILNIHPGES